MIAMIAKIVESKFCQEFLLAALPLPLPLPLPLIVMIPLIRIALALLK
jgi:hypothetical protein